MELLTACQALDLRGDKGLGKGTKLFYDMTRALVPVLAEDRVMYTDINKVEDLIKSNELSKALNTVGISL